MYKHILLPTYGHAGCNRSIQHGIQLAKLCGSKITGLYVSMHHLFVAASDGWINEAVELQLEREAVSRASTALAYLRKAATDEKLECCTLTCHSAGDIVRTAHATGCDLIVIPARGRLAHSHRQMTMLAGRASVSILFLGAEHRS
jgi:nucleotide-binding universal stress UspA family protein